MVGESAFPEVELHGMYRVPLCGDTSLGHGLGALEVPGHWWGMRIPMVMASDLAMEASVV